MTGHGLLRKSWTCLGVGVVAALAFLLGVAVLEVAGAQYLICASHSLNRDDATRLKVAARLVVPKSNHVWIEGACVNPGGALGSNNNLRGRGEVIYSYIDQGVFSRWQGDPK